VQHGRVVRVRATVAAGMAHVVVADDGPGIPDGDTKRVFEPGATTGPGSGLGLPLARRVARSVGGDVTLTAVRGDGLPGAHVLVTLPARPVTPAAGAVD